MNILVYLLLLILGFISTSLTAKILSATAVETLEIDCCQAKKLQHTAVLVSDMVGRNLARTVIGHD